MSSLWMALTFVSVSPSVLEPREQQQPLPLANRELRTGMLPNVGRCSEDEWDKDVRQWFLKRERSPAAAVRVESKENALRVGRQEGYACCLAMHACLLSSQRPTVKIRIIIALNLVCVIL